MQAFTISVVLMSGACGADAGTPTTLANHEQITAVEQDYSSIVKSVRPAFDAIGFVIRQVVQNDCKSN